MKSVPPFLHSPLNIIKLFIHIVYIRYRTQNIHPVVEGCCDSLNVAGKLFANGEYRKLSEQHNGRPIYQHTDVESCIFYGGHWKIDTCNFLTDGDWTQGYGWSDVNAMCPGDIGSQWRYYSWDGSSDSGPVDTEIVAECM